MPIDELLKELAELNGRADIVRGQKVNEEVGKIDEYKYGGETAIIRKAIHLIIAFLKEKYPDADFSAFDKFEKYNETVEAIKSDNEVK